MKNKFVLFLSLAFLLITGFSPVTLIDNANISYPVAEQAVQGSVDIIGEIDIDDFISYQLFFSPEGVTGQNWFPISNGNSQGKNLTLGSWDTNLLSDGQYTIWLSIEIENQASTDIYITGIRVRNYTAFSTNTPTPFPTGPNTPTPTPTIVPNTPTAVPPTDFPANPVELTFDSIGKTFIKSISIVFTLFLLLLFYRKVQK